MTMTRMHSSSLLLVLTLFLATFGSVHAGPKPKPPITIQVLSVSDLHGQLTPVPVGAGVTVGGAAYLKAYFDQDIAANPNTLVLAAGQSFGASPPNSAFFGEVPTVLAMNMMGFAADTFGNHNFDLGVVHLRDMVELANFDFVAANLDPVDPALKKVRDYEIYKVAGLKIAVIGIVNEEAPALIPPGSLGSTVVTDSVTAANKAAKSARKKGADIVIVLAQKGITEIVAGNGTGPLAAFAAALQGVDLVVGGHTGIEYQGTHGGTLAVETRRRGQSYAQILLTYDFGAKAVTTKDATFVTPVNTDVTPDAAVEALITGYNAQIPPILHVVVGGSNVVIPRSDACGRADGRLCESLVGNVITDAMRMVYNVDFAITNSGGIRANLTCPTTDSTSDFCPPYVSGPYPITRGQVLTVLPFGNAVVTLTVNGAELKAMLENGVSAMPGANGRFPQVSGLCFTYDISAAVGSRVTGAVRQAGDGSCTGAAIDLTAATSYTLAENDFMVAGGDGYPPFVGRAEYRDIQDEVVADYVSYLSPLSPAIQGRIGCTTSGSPACPVVIP